MSIERSAAPWRLRPAAALAVVLAMVALLVAPSGMHRAGADDVPFVLGTGQASTQVAKVRLFYAGYALTVPLGISATSYENHQSRSLGSAFDASAALGLIDQKVPELSATSVDSNAGDATKDVNLGAGPVLGHIVLTAKEQPSATSEVHLADIDLPGVLRVEGGHSTSRSEVVDGDVRVAHASLDVGAISLLGGLITMDDLHWETVQRTGAKEQDDGTFTVGRLDLAGIPIASDIEDIQPILDVLNGALAPIGFVIEGPEVRHLESGAVEVTPMRIAIANSPLGAQVLAPTIAGLRPLLLPVFDALADVNGTLGLTALVADLGLGVLDGSGGLEISLGGATSITDDKVYEDPLGGVTPELPTLTPSTPTTPGTIGTLPAPAAAPVATPGSERLIPAVADGPAECVLVASPRRQGGCRGSNVAGAVGIVALVAAGIGAYEVVVRRRKLHETVAGGAS